MIGFLLEEIENVISSITLTQLTVFIIFYIVETYLAFSKIIITDINERYSQNSNSEILQDLLKKKSLRPRYLLKAARYILEEEGKGR